ncbi:PEP/pyruvate-binding domain-containing protein (plasmid) [Halobacteriovorax sp. GFR7]|uniref:PEP/pyruvate-binding domain-containing protein n=1 Tax=unclassified Halobacteriovorax TaxID=2639665 RepID=UPI003D955F99
MGVQVKTGSKYIYTFKQGDAEGSADMRELLGGKGANLAEMCNLGLPVPAGLTITTEACIKYRSISNQEEKESFVKRLANQAMKQLKALNTKEYLPLVSVRSGAQVSMAGMMDTILNVGHHTGRFTELFPVLGAKTCLDSYRRLQQMYGSTVLGIEDAFFAAAIKQVKEHSGVNLDCELSEDGLMTLIKAFDAAYKVNNHQPLELNYQEQLEGSIRAVFDSWDNHRAKVYRKHHGIPEDWGTAVNIQFMVFGNAHGLSGSGVMFTRDTTTGENITLGEFLMNAQGEDVVAGIRTPEPLGKLAKVSSDLHCKLLTMAKTLEEHYNDVQDIEFTIESGELYLLQTRNAKRTAQAEIKIASDFVKDGLWDFCDLQEKINPLSFDLLSKPVLAPTDENKVLATGLGTGGVASGLVATSTEEGLKLKAAGKDFVLWAYETTPNDLEAMLVAKAIVTEIGGQTCHAAVVARSLNLPCVVGTGTPWGGEQIITVDADSGKVYGGIVPCESMQEPDYVRELISYMAECSGLVQHGDYVEGTLYSLVTKEVQVNDKPESFILDLSELGQKLNKLDNQLLALVGSSADQYRDELFKERLEGSPFGWLNQLVNADKLPDDRHVVAKRWEEQPPLVKLVVKSLGFKQVTELKKPLDLIAGGKGFVDEKELRRVLGDSVFDYLKDKALSDGLYPTEVSRVSTRREIIDTLKGE